MDSKKIGSNISPALTTNAPVQRSKEAQKHADAGKVGARAGAEADYNVNLSGKGKEINDARAKALEIAKNTPDIREDRVMELKKKIESGEYKVSSENIADGILREAIRDELSKGEAEL